MLFRYKIKECCYESLEHVLHGPGIGYLVKIQYYKPNAKLFKWKYFKTSKLCYVLNQLGHQSDYIGTNDGLFDVLQQYNGIGEIMIKYIKKIMEDNNYKQYQKDVGNKIDDFVLTKGWNTIEVKENA